MLQKAIAILSFLIITQACSKAPISGRKQVNLLEESDMISMSFKEYSDFILSNEVVSPNDPRAEEMLKVGRNIAETVGEFLKEKQLSDQIEGFEWEFNLIEDDNINVWCMPGGKVIVFTGILPICKDETGLAVVISHEIAHTIARHGNERMSEQIQLEYGGQTLSVLLENNPEKMQELFLNSYGVGEGVDSKPFSASQETEADKLGLVFMAMAGYNPQEAIVFWEAIANVNGKNPPELLSTHSSDETRINNLKAYMPEAMKFYKP